MEEEVEGQEGEDEGGGGEGIQKLEYDCVELCEHGEEREETRSVQANTGSKGGEYCWIFYLLSSARTVRHFHSLIVSSFL